jgi:hypothetical protein
VSKLARRCNILKLKAKTGAAIGTIRAHRATVQRYLLFLPLLLGCGSDTTVPADSPHCSPSDPCPTGRWCEYAEELCVQEPSATGTCVSEQCEGVVPHCGCDQNVYSTVCAAHEAGVSVTDAAGCSVGTFSCGDKACRAYVELCRETVYVEGDSDYACAPVDSAQCSGGIAGCECLGFGPNHIGEQFCSESPDGYVTVVTHDI